MPTIKICSVCGKEFHKPVTCSKKDWEDRSFCSYPCYWKHKFGKRKTKPKKCQYCGREYFSWENGVTNARKRFCSKDCFGLSRRMERKPCETCGKKTNRARARFCSAECKNSWYRGENVYNYRSEETGHLAKSMSGFSFGAAKAKEIRERDRVCRHCGKTPEENGRALDVHHVIPYRISQDDSPSNLIALCRSCHKIADHKARHEHKS